MSVQKAKLFQYSVHALVLIQLYGGFPMNHTFLLDVIIIHLMYFFFISESIQRYGKSPYLYPLYGLGELPQGFAR